jgi:hypothetical protein
MGHAAGTYGHGTSVHVTSTCCAPASSGACPVSVWRVETAAHSTGSAGACVVRAPEERGAAPRISTTSVTPALTLAVSRPCVRVPPAHDSTMLKSLAAAAVAAVAAAQTTYYVDDSAGPARRYDGIGECGEALLVGCVKPECDITRSMCGGNTAAMRWVTS